MIAGLDDQFGAVLLLKSAVGFFALVAGIHNRFPNFVILIGVLKLFHEWDQSVYIVAVGTNIIADDKFVADGRVHVIPRFQLAVPHMIFLHVHEGGVMIGFAVAVLVPAYMQVIGILFEFGQSCFRLFQHSLQLCFSLTLPVNHDNTGFFGNPYTSIFVRIFGEYSFLPSREYAAQTLL